MSDITSSANLVQRTDDVSALVARIQLIVQSKGTNSDSGVLLLGENTHRMVVHHLHDVFDVDTNAADPCLGRLYSYRCFTGKGLVADALLYLPLQVYQERDSEKSDGDGVPGGIKCSDEDIAYLQQRLSEIVPQSPAYSAIVLLSTKAYRMVLSHFAGDLDPNCNVSDPCVGKMYGHRCFVGLEEGSDVLCVPISDLVSL